MFDALKLLLPVATTVYQGILKNSCKQGFLVLYECGNLASYKDPEQPPRVLAVECLELPFRVCKQFLVCSEVEHFALERKNVTLTLIYKDGCQCGHLLWVPETFILNHTLRNIFTNKFLNMEFYSVERNI